MNVMNTVVKCTLLAMVYKVTCIGLECSWNNDGWMKIVTDSILHNDSIRAGRALAVPSSIDSLHSEDIVCSRNQSIAHES